MLYFLFCFYVSNPSKWISLWVLCWKISIMKNKYIHFNVTSTIALVQCAMVHLSFYLVSPTVKALSFSSWSSKLSHSFTYIYFIIHKRQTVTKNYARPPMFITPFNLFQCITYLCRGLTHVVCYKHSNRILHTIIL